MIGYVVLYFALWNTHQTEWNSQTEDQELSGLKIFLFDSWYGWYYFAIDITIALMRHSLCFND